MILWKQCISHSLNSIPIIVLHADRVQCCLHHHIPFRQELFNCISLSTTRCAKWYVFLTLCFGHV
jgi:hypothetical protein